MGRLLLGFLGILSLVCSPSEGHPQSRDFPCPADNDILPCICTFNSEFDMTLDCSNIKTENELSTALNAQYPFDQFFRLYINQEHNPNSQFTTLGGHSLGQLTFEEIDISTSPLATINDNTFSKSHKTLKKLKLDKNQISTFTWESLPDYELLETLNVAQNLLQDLPPVESSTLKVLNVGGNAIVHSISENTVIGAPNLEEIHFDDMGITELVPHTFKSMEKLKILRFNRNLLTKINENDINPPGKSLIELDFDYNEITGLHYNAIAGLSVNASVRLEYNSIVELDIVSWEPLFQQVDKPGAISLEGNRLSCGCDVAWIVRDSHYISLVDQTTDCVGGELLVNIPVEVIDALCPP